MEWWNNGIMGLKKRIVSNFKAMIGEVYLKRSYSAKPIIPIFQYSITPWHSITAEPVISDLAQRTRSSMLE
jgi:hypothetical protein